ncbi:hypothetical protein H4582DRAFT_2086034 [Lactarius indigo]|nr:hypothetical protein H4582DRAFT_2086034 [Lactarius indigo]
MSRYSSASYAAGLSGQDRAFVHVTQSLRGPSGHDPEGPVCVLRSTIKDGPAFGGFRADYELILEHITQQHSWTV